MLNEAWRSDYIAGHVPNTFKSSIIDDYMTCGNKYAEDAIHAVREWIELCASDRRPSVMYGEPGAAKTMLAAALFKSIGLSIDDRRDIKDVMMAGTADNVFWVRGDELVRYWQGDKELEGASNSMHQREYHTATAALGCIDDIDKFPLSSENWMKKLLNLIDMRVQDKKMPTIITMNITPEQLATSCGEVSASIVSRLERNGAYFIEVPKLDSKLILEAQKQRVAVK